MYLTEEWVGFICGYSNQVPCVADTCKILFYFMPNLSNNANIFLNFCVRDISEKNGLILFTFGAVISHNRDLMHVKYTLVLCQNVAFMSIISELVYVSSDRSEMNQWILFMFGTAINHHKGFMHEICNKIEEKVFKLFHIFMA